MLINGADTRSEFIGAEAVAHRCSVKNLFLEILQNSLEKTPVPIKKETLAQVVSCELCKISKNTFSYSAPLMVTSVKVKEDVHMSDRSNIVKKELTLSNKKLRFFKDLLKVNMILLLQCFSEITCFNKYMDHIIKKYLYFRLGCPDTIYPPIKFDMWTNDVSQSLYVSDEVLNQKHPRFK